MSLYIEGHTVGRRSYYICGIPGQYAVKSCGNNRILVMDLLTLDDARSWING